MDDSIAATRPVPLWVAPVFAALALVTVPWVGYLAVTLEEDPNADLQIEHGRFFYFSPDEVEALPEAGA